MSPGSRTKIMALIAGIAVLGIARYLFLKKHELDLATEEVPPKPTITHKPAERKRVAPNGTFSVRLTRLPFPQLEVISATKKSQYLFLTNEKTREYDLYSNGAVRHLTGKAMNIAFYLTPNGTLIQSGLEPTAAASSSSGFPYNDSSSDLKYFEDGSIAVIRKVAPMQPSGSSASPFNAVYKGPSAKNLSPSARDFNPKKDYYSVMRERHGIQTMKSPAAVIMIHGIEELYRSNRLVSVLATDVPGQVWLQEHDGLVSAGKDSLVCVANKVPTSVDLPKGYTNVHRMTQTGSRIAGTFGILNGEQPFRSFLREGTEWKELPVPTGFDFSFSQKILDNGLIVGFVTTWDGKNLKHVVWKDGAVAILDDLPGWPKQGDLSLVYKVTRNGTLAVRNITDTTSGASEYYLLSLSL